MNNVTIADITPPRGKLMLDEEYKAYTARRIDELESEGRIDAEFAEQLRDQYDA